MENGQDAQDDRRAADAGPKPQLLPHDLDRALTYLPQGELQRLAEAVAFETRRRKMAAAREGTPVVAETGETATADPKPPRADGAQLTAAQISLIRSSIKAGVKPSALQRQFGISRAQIAAVLKG